MAKSNEKIALVSGASSGIGETTAERPFEILPVDVNSNESVAAVSEGVRRNGRIDLLANNAGFAHDYARRSRHSYSPAASM